MVVTDKDKQELLEFWESDDFNLYELQVALQNKLNYEVHVAFLGEPQTKMLKIFLDKLLAFIDDYHNGKDSESHPDLRETIKTLEAKFRNHRHETGKTFSAKPEY